MKEISILKKKILQYLDYKGITKYKFYQDTGVSNSVLSQESGLSESNILRILSYYRDLSADWLFRDEGDMLRSGIVKECSLVNNVNPGIVEDPEQFYGHLKKAPLIPIDVIRKQKLRVWEYVQRHKELYETFPDNLMPEFDLIHIVRSNALQPAVEKGDILFLEHLELTTDSVVNGHIYFMDTKMNGIVIKKVFVEDGKLTCYSLANNVPVKRFSVDDIFDIFSIVSILKFSIPNSEQVDIHIHQLDKLLDSTHEVVAQNSALIEELSAQRRMVEHLVTGRNAV